MGYFSQLQLQCYNYIAQYLPTQWRRNEGLDSAVCAHA